MYLCDTLTFGGAWYGRSESGNLFGAVLVASAVARRRDIEDDDTAFGIPC